TTDIVDCYANIVVPVPPTVTDNCGFAIALSGPVETGTAACEGVITYTWTYTDCEGNTQNYVHTATIEYEPFAAITSTTDIADCYANIVLPTPPVIVDNCGVTLVPTGPVETGISTCEGAITYTWTYFDCEENTHNYVHTVLVEYGPLDPIPPSANVADCYADIIIPTPPVVTDNCGIIISPTGPIESGSAACGGVITFTWTYTDCTGSSQLWVYTYTINPPSFTLPTNGSSTVSCIVDAQVVPVPPAIDNSCGLPLTLSGPVVGPDPQCSGVKTYLWTYTDCTGQTGIWVYTYTITPATFVLPADGSSTVACIIEAQIIPVPPAVDNSCGFALMITGPVVGPDPDCSGTKSYTWTYTDCSGSTDQWNYTYVITPPTAVLPSDGGSTVDCLSDAQIIPVPPQVFNSCGDSLTISGHVTGPDPFCSGTKTYTWTYTDCTGGTMVWIYTYTITADLGPVFDNPPVDVTVSCIDDIPVMTILAYTNTCSPDGAVSGFDSPISSSCPGIVTRLWTFTDECGNTSTESQLIFIHDQIQPTASDPAAITLIGCNTDIPVPDINVVIDEADNCSEPLIVSFLSDATSFVGCTETTTRTYSVTDACGNSIVVSQEIIRTVDTTPPVINTPPADISVNCIADVPPIVDLTFTDNCTPGGFITGISTGPGGDPLTIINTWTVTDDCGNMTSVSQTITINEDLIPLLASGDFCEGGSVIVYGTSYNVPGIYQDTIPGSNGECDTLITVTIIELQTAEINLSDDFCEGGTYTLPDGNTTTMGGTFGPYTFTGVNGCDSIVNLDLTVLPTKTGEENYTGCEGDGYSVVVNGTIYNEGNPLGTETIIISGTCDSIVSILLIYLPHSAGNELYTGCEGDGYSVIVNGSIYDESDPTGTEVLVGSNGCDSVVTIDLTFLPQSTGTEIYIGCEGDGYGVVVNG
ncbi:MAG: hypothetical protein ABIQ11_11710, partial [Saprospiraceae bacterium]